MHTRTIYFAVLPGWGSYQCALWGDSLRIFVQRSGLACEEYCSAAARILPAVGYTLFQPLLALSRG